MILFHLIEQPILRLRGEDDEDDAAADKAFHCFTTSTSQSAENRVNSLKLRVNPPKNKPDFFNIIITINHLKPLLVNINPLNLLHSFLLLCNRS